MPTEVDPSFVALGRSSDCLHLGSSPLAWLPSPRSSPGGRCTPASSLFGSGPGFALLWLR